MSVFSYSLSVIIPIYNVEKFIHRCVRSLFEQTLPGIEFIFIDDCSLDSSVQVLQQVLASYPEKQLHTHILRNERNKGIAAVRNIGLNVAKGKYIGWVDADDWIEPDMYIMLYQEALQTSSDIVWCDYYNSYPDHEDRQFQSCNPSIIDYIKALLLGYLHGGLCFTIIKKSLFFDNSIFFPEGRNVMEDKNVLIKLACFAQRISYLPFPFYHYIKYNHNSITSNWGADPEVELCARINLDNIFTFLSKSDLAYDFTKEIIYAKLIFKKAYLNHAVLESFQKWKSIYSEANSHILACPNMTLKQRVLGWLIMHNYYLPINLWVMIKKNTR